METTIKTNCTLARMNEAISNPTLAAAAIIAIVLGGVSVSGIVDNPHKIKQVVELVQSKVQVGSVMNVDYAPGRILD